MIVIDSSALLAVLFEEEEKSAFQAIIDGEDRCIVSAVNAYETACVLRGKRGSVLAVQFWQWLANNRIEISPFDDMQGRAAVAAYNRYGKGVHSAARLNLCDCVAYALAKAMNVPLLYKGNDFSETDIKAAVLTTR